MKNVIGIIGLALLVFVSCSKDETNSGSVSGKSSLSMALTDAPGDYEQVNVDVQSIRVHVSQAELDSSEADSLADGDSGWLDMPIIPQVYNLIELQDSSAVLFSQFEVPAGRISQIRLILGDSNSVKLEGDSMLYDLKVPSGMKSGLKLNFQQNLAADSAYSILVDFDAEKSVNQQGNGQYQLKPVIRVTLE